ncbi:hypothetical protein [Actinomadura chibensis]|uniref:Uncharacterized protein n=1 Tax=Actinomadura chibensis TaxID=392828 RepID=A0A5D0NXN9_9ACTN|nr:hypothetical protein [Actinomadura chibensis]TYB48761.1 hypothetical protein FXF69_06210 [Actinomadura chibensis]
MSEGIQAFQARLRIPGDGRPRLVILRDSVVERDPALVEAAKPACTVEEIGGYVWAVKPGGAVKEELVKEQDDGMDAARYMVAKADLGARPASAGRRRCTCVSTCLEPAHAVTLRQQVSRCIIRGVAMFSTLTGAHRAQRAVAKPKRQRTPVGAPRPLRCAAPT